MKFKIFASLTAGFVGSFIGTPPDVVLIRDQLDKMSPPEERRNYKNVFDAFIKIIREEGMIY